MSGLGRASDARPPLTPAMVRALQRARWRPLRAVALWGPLFAAIGAGITRIPNGGASYGWGVTALVALVVLGAALAIGGGGAAFLAWRGRRAVATGTYLRAIGSLHCVTSGTGAQARTHLRLDGGRHDLLLKPGVRAKVEALERGVIAYSPEADLLFAVWDEQGACRYAAPDYAPDDAIGDPEWAQRR